MKNSIYLNYGILVDKIYNNYFIFNNEKIFIKKYNNENIDILFKLTNDLYNHNIKVNTFILNKDNNYISTFRNNKYILYKENRYVEKVTLNDLKQFWNINSSLDNYDITEDWSKEVDTLEQEIIEYNNEFIIIKNSIDYYIGYAENAIELLNMYKGKFISDSIGHKYSNKLDEDYLDNPFNFIKTNKMFDISTYFKYKLFNNSIDYEEIEEIINSNSEVENVFLFSCLMYPDYYFYMVKKIILDYTDEKSLNYYIKRIKIYNNLLIFCQTHIKNNSVIKNINWIK